MVSSDTVCHSWDSCAYADHCGELCVPDAPFLAAAVDGEGDTYREIVDESAKVHEGKYQQQEEEEQEEEEQMEHGKAKLTTLKFREQVTHPLFLLAVGMASVFSSG